jgi:hypothetical protein
MSKRFLICAAVTSTVLALPHLLPPTSSGFIIERYWLAASRVVQGLPEFASFSVLSILGLMSPPAMFVSVVSLNVLLALGLRQMARSTDELAEITPAVLFVIALFGVLAVNAGGTLVAPSEVCYLGPSESATQKIVSYRELGWAPGAHYFLLERNLEVGDWIQVGYARLDVPEPDPCSSLVGIFPP